MSKMSTMKPTNRIKGESDFVKVSVVVTKDMEKHVHARTASDPELNFSRYVRSLIKRDMAKAKAA